MVISFTNIPKTRETHWYGTNDGVMCEGQDSRKYTNVLTHLIILSELAFSKEKVKHGETPNPLKIIIPK